MKWISPALAPTAALAPALLLALLSTTTVTGQSTTSRLDHLAPGPVAELSTGYSSTSAFQSGTLDGDPIIQPPVINPLPGDSLLNQLPPPQPSVQFAQPQNSIINQPAPSYQTPQHQSGLGSSTKGFTLPRTPSVSHQYLQNRPLPNPPALPATNSYANQDSYFATDQNAIPSGTVSGSSNAICACGSNALAPDDCQCDACQGRPSLSALDSQHHGDHHVIVESCDTCQSSDIVSDDCGCDTCEEVSCTDCSGDYFETPDRGFTNNHDDVENREIKQGPIARHFKKHFHKKKQPHQTAALDNHRGEECYACQTGSCDEHSFTPSSDVFEQTEYPQHATNDVYQPAVVQPRDKNDVYTNTLLNVSGVFFNRNTPNIPLSTERVPAGGVASRTLGSGDADPGNFGGIDASIIRRRATGKGIELRYLNLSPGESTSTFAGSPLTLVSQFGQIGQPGGINHQQAFNLANVHEVSRDFTIQNAEFNLLRMGRQASTRKGQEASFEYLLGFRYFKFEESLNYSAFGIRPNTATGGDITRADYLSEVENELFGAQFGGRSEINLFKRLSLLVGLKAGIFQNNLSSQQRATTRGIAGEERVAQVLNGPTQGSLYDLAGEDTDYTLLGELDLGLTYRVTNSIRLRGGYKAIFVDDIAFADNQIASDFRNVQFNSTPQANDDLVLYGGYFGIDFAF